MAQRSQQVRLAIAILEELAALWSVLGALLQSGIAAEQIDVAVPGAALGDAGRAALADPVLGPIGARLEPVPLGGAPALATRGPLTLALRGGDDGGSTELVAWMSPVLRVELIRHIHNGAVILGVRADSDAQQRSNTRILLQYAAHRVQTHEFTVTV